MHYRLPPGSGSKAILGYTRHEWGALHFYAAIALAALVALHVALHWKWVTNTFGSLVRSREAKRAGAGVGGAAILAAIGLATAAVVAVPWAFPIGTGADDGHGKGYRGGRTASDAATPTASKETGGEGCSETCDDTCPTDPAALAARHGKGQGQGQGRGGGEDADGIRGSTSLAEAAAQAGVPLERLIAELKLPRDTAPAETLGRLRQQHGFTMQDVRLLVARLKAQKGNP
ncbi:MAG: DUF4405 domain-containing protein [Planctomycetes bacterium]|nr:DUF4405 domain-containing protein [Planctomycetota bacterium]